ncbi:MAG: transposase [Nostoc sp.]
MKFTKLNYCQYLLSSQINYTLTNLAEHLEQISHDKINHYLKNEKLTPRLLWDNVKDIIDDTTCLEDYKRIELLSWNEEELKSGKIIKIKKFPQAKKVKLFRITVSTDRTDFIATNDLSQDSTDVVQKVCKVRWKVEEFHRELKQLTGIESCQCRKGPIQRNHIACAILVWLRLKDLAYRTGKTIYQIKHGLLSNYLVQQLKRPAVPMFIA